MLSILVASGLALDQHPNLCSPVVGVLSWRICWANGGGGVGILSWLICWANASGQQKDGQHHKHLMQTTCNAGCTQKQLLVAHAPVPHKVMDMSGSTVAFQGFDSRPVL